jgi:hypothetical protein
MPPPAQETLKGFKPMSRTIHVIQGHYAGERFVQAMHPQPGELLENEDVLSCGPLPPLRSIEEWAQLRKAFWDTVASSDDDRPFNRDLLANSEALRNADAIVLWLGIGAAEQLLLAWTVKLLKLIGSQAQLHVVQFTHAGNRNIPAWGVGLLDPEQIKHHPPATLVPAAAILELERLWEGVTSTDPSGLLSVLSGQTTELQHSRASLQGLIRRYPDYKTGLGRWDSELLKYTKENGPRATRIIGETMGVNFDSDLVGDMYLFSRLHGLARPDLARPLVTMSGDPYDMRNCEVVLTDAGESVLAGQVNAVELNGIDDWILGVHLDSERGSVWYQREGTLVPRWSH